MRFPPHGNRCFSFGVVGLIAAYNEGEEWLSQLLEYLYDNYMYMKEYIEARFPKLTVTRLERKQKAHSDIPERRVHSVSRRPRQ